KGSLPMKIVPETSPQDNPVSSASVVPTRRRDRVYPFHDQDGKVLFEEDRCYLADGSKKVRMRQRTEDSWRGIFIWNINDCPRVIYRWPELLKADKALPIYIVEGPPKVDLLREWGLLATCNPHGAGKWKKVEEQCLDVFTDRDVIILPDNDEP